jgi:hypothetical protein
MSRAAQFAVVVGVAGMLLLGAGTAAPRPSPQPVAPLAAGPGFCFAGRPCPGSRAATCFADANARTDTKTDPKLACPKSQVTYRFADTPRAHAAGGRP